MKNNITSLDKRGDKRRKLGKQKPWEIWTIFKRKSQMMTSGGPHKTSLFKWQTAPVPHENAAVEYLIFINTEKDPYNFQFFFCFREAQTTFAMTMKERPLRTNNREDLFKLECQSRNAYWLETLKLSPKRPQVVKNGWGKVTAYQDRWNHNIQMVCYTVSGFEELGIC